MTPGGLAHFICRTSIPDISSFQHARRFWVLASFSPETPDENLRHRACKNPGPLEALVSTPVAGYPR